MAKYLVTGGCGFIGSHLVDALVRAGHDIVVVDNLSTGKLENLNPGVKFIHGDVTDPLLINKLLKDRDGCFHLAALVSIEYSNSHWLPSHLVNLTGTITVLDCAKSAKNGKPIPVVYASSSAIYGDNTKMPLTESMEPDPQSVYAADKLSGEFHAHAASKIFHIPTIGLRLFDVYGPRQNPKSHYSHVISTFLEQMISDKPIKIYGEGNQVRDFLYVSDAVNYFLQAMYTAEAHSEIYNVCSGQQTSVNQLVTTMQEVLHKDDITIVKSDPKKQAINITVGSPQKANKRFNIKTLVDLRQGLTQMLLNFSKMHEATEQSQFYKTEQDTKKG